ncbi:MAG: gamma carbonic anhydrase family protein [Gammaproteobacteria bacterium]|nr:gamma carbonic anhydrase family protein [Gammaproteobacteria bacterium]MDH3766941.1 gamma carbonic anhydrase family protein [Gammaproteobacteria bacterium]
MLRKYENHVPQLGERVYVDESARLIGRVRCGDDVSVWPMVVARGDVNEIIIGDRSNIQDGSVLHVTHDGPYTPGGIALVIGTDVTVGHKVMLHACTISDRCLIGMGAIVMDGVAVEAEVMIGAGSLVTPGKRLKSQSLYRGSPARRIRELTEEEIGQLDYSAQHYVKLKNRYLASA